MKKIFFLTVSAVAVLFASCGSSKNATVSTAPRSANPFGDVFEVPAAENDTEEYFGATGIATGSKSRMGELQELALENAQNMIRRKMKHAYKGMVSDYINSVGNNVGTDIEAKVEGGGDQIIDVIVNETMASKGPFFSTADEKGNVTCYIGIRISKKETVDKITNYVSNDEELKIRFKEDQFRKRMEETFKNYKENN